MPSFTNMSTELPAPRSIQLPCACACACIASAHSTGRRVASFGACIGGRHFPSLSLGHRFGSRTPASQSTITQDSAILTVLTEPIQLPCLGWMNIIDVCENEDLLGSRDVDHYLAAQLGRTWRASSQHLVKSPFEPPAVPKIG